MSTLLIEHGTLLSRLKVSNIVQAAEADLRLRQRKRDHKADPEERYSFARRHVQRAASVAHLLALAYFEPKPKTDKRSTLIVYSDYDLLRETLVAVLDGDHREVV